MELTLTPGCSLRCTGAATLLLSLGIKYAWGVFPYLARENFQLAGHKGQQEPIVRSWKTLHLAGDYGKFHYRALYGAPNFGPRGGGVDVEKV